MAESLLGAGGWVCYPEELRSRSRLKVLWERRGLALVLASRGGSGLEGEKIGTQKRCFSWCL